MSTQQEVECPNLSMKLQSSFQVELRSRLVAPRSSFMTHKLAKLFKIFLSCVLICATAFKLL